MPKSSIPGEHEISTANASSDDHFSILRRLGMGLLFACVFVPSDLLGFVVVLASGVYICIRAALYLRQYSGAS